MDDGGRFLDLSGYDLDVGRVVVGTLTLQQTLTTALVTATTLTTISLSVSAVVANTIQVSGLSPLTYLRFVTSTVNNAQPTISYTPFLTTTALYPVLIAGSKTSVIQGGSPATGIFHVVDSTNPLCGFRFGGNYNNGLTTFTNPDADVTGIFYFSFDSGVFKYYDPIWDDDLQVVHTHPTNYQINFINTTVSFRSTTCSDSSKSLANIASFDSAADSRVKVGVSFLALPI